MPVQIKKSSTVIPRNSHIEANQSGLIAEPLIDITPQLPIPDYKVMFMLTLHSIPDDASRPPAPQLAICPQPCLQPSLLTWGKDVCTLTSFLGVRDRMAVQANPLDPECEAEGKVVCSQGHIKGEPGDLSMLIPHLSACQSACRHLQDPLHCLFAHSTHKGCWTHQVCPCTQVWLHSLRTLHLQEKLIRAVKLGMDGRHSFTWLLRCGHG